MGLFISGNSSRNESNIRGGGNAQKKEKKPVVDLRKRLMTCCVFKPHMMVMFSKFPAHGNERLLQATRDRAALHSRALHSQQPLKDPTLQRPGPLQAVFLATEKLAGPSKSRASWESWPHPQCALCPPFNKSWAA